MKFIDKIKDKVADFVLNRELLKQERHSYIQNFDSARIIGFIFDARENSEYEASMRLINFAKEEGLEIYGLGIINSIEQINALPHKENITFFILNEKNWFGKPDSKWVTDFLKITFDIFIDISMYDVFSLKYIFACANAKFKITNSGEKSKYADFVLEIDNNQTIDNFTKNIIYYLNSITVD